MLIHDAGFLLTRHVFHSSKFCNESGLTPYCRQI